MAEDVLYIGIDLGTFRSVMVSSGNHEEEELTVIGTPKDLIARNFPVSYTHLTLPTTPYV